MAKKSVSSKKSAPSKKSVPSRSVSSRSVSSIDDEDDLDGCDVPVKTATLDEELPAAEGGVK